MYELNPLSTRVASPEEAREIISDLILMFSGEVAYNRLKENSKASKQSIEEAALRTAGNVLNSLVTRKPSGFVLEP